MANDHKIAITGLFKPVFNLNEILERLEECQAQIDVAACVQEDSAPQRALNGTSRELERVIKALSEEISSERLRQDDPPLHSNQFVRRTA